MAFEKASLVYKRECSLDFAPSPWAGPQRVRVVNGVLVGFALVVPGDIPILEHLWTCARLRRSGVAGELVQELVEELGGPLHVFHVVSHDGEAWCEQARRAGLIAPCPDDAAPTATW